MGGEENCLVEWAQGTQDGLECIGSNYYYISTNVDGMAHSGKGIVGLRMTNSENVKFAGDIIVENLYDLTPEGYDEKLYDIQGLKHATIRRIGLGAYQSGFSMNQIMGISADKSDITVNK